MQKHDQPRTSVYALLCPLWHVNQTAFCISKMSFGPFCFAGRRRENYRSGLVSGLRLTRTHPLGWRRQGIHLCVSLWNVLGKINKVKKVSANIFWVTNNELHESRLPRKRKTLPVSLSAKKTGNCGLFGRAASTKYKRPFWVTSASSSVLGPRRSFFGVGNSIGVSRTSLGCPVDKCHSLIDEASF